MRSQSNAMVRGNVARWDWCCRKKFLEGKRGGGFETGRGLEMGLDEMASFCPPYVGIS